MAQAALKSALAGLVAPLPPREFIEQHFPSRMWAMHGEMSRLPPVLSGPRLSSLKSLALAHRGRLLMANAAKSSYMVPTSNANASVLSDFGLTVVLDDVAACIEGMPEYLQALRQELGASARDIRVDGFASPAGTGAPCHYDVVDVFSIQLTGRKRFEVAPMTEIANPMVLQYAPGAAPFDDLYAQASGGFPQTKGVAFSTVDMLPGSVLFLPRGT
jgi:ribosomal protein L16 Arg81 hydroxylase